MNKEIKMIVMDMDDTLLNDNLEISDYTKKVISNAQNKGIKIVLASGRPTPAILKFAEELRLHEFDDYIISYNGATLTRCKTGETISMVYLTRDNVKYIKSVSKSQDLNFQTYLNDEVVADRDNEYTRFEGKLTNMPVVISKETIDNLDQEVVKVILTGEPDKLKLVERELKDEVGDSIMINISKPFFLEFTNKDVDKDKTITKLCTLLNIPKDSVMAIGDSFNDLSMIKGCGLGVVMANGHQDVKKHAHYITHCNNTDGVATAINRFALQV
jgi:Cof subfamily protein (haloacid dehalogenase superfamily)